MKNQKWVGKGAGKGKEWDGYRFGTSRVLPHSVRHFRPRHLQKKGLVAKSRKMAGHLLTSTSLNFAQIYGLKTQNLRAKGKLRLLPLYFLLKHFLTCSFDASMKAEIAFLLLVKHKAVKYSVIHQITFSVWEPLAYKDTIGLSI